MATSPAGVVSQTRLRGAVDVGVELSGTPIGRTTSDTSKETESTHKRTRAVGSLAHVAATALRRKNIGIRALVAFVILLFTSAGVLKITRRVLFAVDLKGHCDSLDPSARVALLLAGSPHAFNRTHCSFSKHVIAPLRARGHPVDVFFSSTEILKTTKESGAGKAAMKNLEREHDISFTLVDMASRGFPESCFDNLRARYGGIRSEGTLGVGVTLAESDAKKTDKEDNVERTSFDTSPDVIRSFLKRLRARAVADASRKYSGKKHDWIIVSDPSSSFGDDVPVDRLCLVPGGRRAHFPWVKSRGGVNDRFAMGAAQGMSELVDLYSALCPTEILKTTKESGAGKAAMKNLEREHDISFTLVDMASRGFPESCFDNLRARYGGIRSEGTLGVGVTLAESDAKKTDKEDNVERTSFDTSPDVIRSFLKRLRARAVADASRKYSGKKHDWIIVSDPSSSFGDDVPVDRLCLVPGGRRAHFPWVKSRGGVNDRFAMGAAQGMSELVDLYSALCPEDTTFDVKDPSGGVLGNIGEVVGAMMGNLDEASRKNKRDSIASSIPRGVDSTERLVQWHMRKRHVLVDTDALYRFVPYETPVDKNRRLDDREWPNARLGRSAFNPSQADFSQIVEEVERCPERNTDE